MGMVCPGCAALGPEEQLFLNGCTNDKTIEGPGFKIVPIGYSSKRRQGIVLQDTEYMIIEDTIGGTLKVVKGPRLVFLGAYEKNRSGNQRKLKAYSLGPTDYLHITDEKTGELKMVQGPRLFFPGAYDKVSKVKTAIALRHNEYIKVLDTETGKVRVCRGEDLVFLEPTEELHVEKSQAVEIDEEVAVLVRNLQSGRQYLICGKGLFFPRWYEEILEVRELVRLADHETMIIKDRNGKFIFRSGSADQDRPEMKTKVDRQADEKAAVIEMQDLQRTADGTFYEMNELPPGDQRCFFLPPYCEIVELMWSSGLLREERNDRVTRLDSRPQFMNYEFICRTNDNVELILDITFFWSLVSVPAMIENTDDAPGDICHHARSEIIQHVSHVDLQTFMSDFNPIVQKAVLEHGQEFYSQRGVEIHTVEVRSMKCKDKDTERVLQQIIQETTNRMNRMQKQTSENEVALFKLKGDIDEEKLNGELLKIKHSHHREEWLMEGQAEADRVNAFMIGLEQTVPDIQTRVQLFNTLRKVEALNKLGEGPAHLYFTPADVDLSIETVVADSQTGALPKRKRELAQQTLARIREDQEYEHKEKMTADVF